ncbi:unnamed protein product [Oreochromis niloticus]|nr:unnamed protein product [Mustela putorius furo]
MGVAGIGKTVLTQKYTLDWAEDKANQDIQFIFPFTFRELNVLNKETFSLVELVHHFFSETKEAGICSFEHFQVVFIFDGLDECQLSLDFYKTTIVTDPRKSTSVDVLLINLIRGKLLPSARLWITTRPAAANQIPPDCVHMVTEVRGFTDPKKEEYFIRRSTDEASRIISYIKTSRSLHIMCHIPVFCWITATVLEDVLKTREGGELPKTLTEMYIHFLVVQAKVKKVKYDGGAETDSHWSPESRKMIESLGKLAFDQLQRGNLIFYESDLTECGIDIRAASVYSGVFTQIFKEERGLYQDKVFCFIHLSVQEFLAALHVHLTFINSGLNLMEEQQTMFLKSETRESAEKHFYQSAVNKALQSPNGHLDLFLRFLLGLSLQPKQDLLQGLLVHTGSSSQTNQETVHYIKKKLGENLSAEKSINLFHCLNELNDRSLLEEIQQSVRSGSLSTDKLSPAQWSALVFILLSSENDLDVFDLKKYSASEEVLLRLLPVVKISNKALVAVYVDSPAGTLSFYRVSSDTLIHLHTFNTTFTETLYPGLWVCSGSSVSLGYKDRFFSNNTAPEAKVHLKQELQMMSRAEAEGSRAEAAEPPAKLFLKAQASTSSSLDTVFDEIAKEQPQAAQPLAAGAAIELDTYLGEAPSPREDSPLKPSKVWRPISPHHFPCRWQTPSDIGALVVLCVREWVPGYPPAHSLAAAYRGMEPGARSGHFGDGVPSASRPGARSLRHSWLPAELTGTSLQPPLASAPRLLSDPSSGTLLSSFWDSGAAAPLLVFLGLLCSGGLWMSGVLISSIPASCPGGPTEEKLDRCKKDDLILIANFFDVTVPLNAKKKELKELLCIKLHERGLFDEPGPAEGVELGAVAGIPAPLKNLPPQPGPSAEELQLTLRIKEVELKKQQLEVDAMHLRVRALEIERGASVSASPPTPRSAPQSPSPQSPSPKPEDSFDVSRHIKLVPAFRETEVDSYFTVFECIAGALHWPKNVWSLLLQCKLVGKAQEVCTALSLEDSLDYDIVKAAVLRAYELVPEAYRQKFRGLRKTATQTYVEFAREKKTLFDKWCYLPSPPNSVSPEIWSPKNTCSITSATTENRECYHCHEQGHLIAACPILKRKEQSRKAKSPSPISFLQTNPCALEGVTVLKTEKDRIDDEFKPFVSKGFASLVGEEKKVAVNILRDTGAKQSLICEGVLPFSAQSYCGADVLAWGVEMGVMRVPLHSVQLSSQFVSGEVKLGVRPQLPVEGIDIILGNDLAGCKVFPLPEVVETPIADTSASDVTTANCDSLFPVCAVTRAQAHKYGEFVDLSDSFLSDSDPTSSPPNCESTPVSVELQPDEKPLTLPVEKNKLIKAQKNDESLSCCWASVTEPKCGKSASYLIEDGVLMRYWTPSSGCTHEGVQQTVVPQSFRSQVLSLAHDHIMSGHLGITKTYNRVLRYFFWPGLKSDVVKFCRSCHTCQLAGKPNQWCLKSKLKKKFQIVVEGNVSAENIPVPLNQIYTELYITEGGTAEDNDEHGIREIETPSKKPQRQETTKRQEDIFKGSPERIKQIRTVLTKGVAGIGKTVLTQKFILDWAEGIANQDIKFIFPFTFRELNVVKEEKFSLVELVHHFFTETKEAGMCRFEEFQVVFIFDGLDECQLPLDFYKTTIVTDPRKSTSVDVLLINLIRGKLLPSSRLWLTTRPGVAGQIPLDCVDMVTEIRGFTDLQMEEYFRKRFRDEEQASRIISHTKTPQSLHIMCHIPVFCWITATVLEDVPETREGGQLPKTLTEMYIHFLVVQAKVKKVKYDGGAETDPHWSPESRKMIESLGKLAFDQLQRGNLIFYESDLTECGIDNRAASVFSGVFTQIFKEERGLYQNNMFCFIHLSVQEFLAALHVHLTFINSGINLMEEQQKTSQKFETREEPVERHIYQSAVYKALQSPNGHLDLFLRFLLGLSLQANQTLLQGLLPETGSSSQTNQETVQYIKKKLGENLSAEKSINLFHCLNELNDRSLVEEIQQSRRSGSLSTDKLSPSQWSALVFILLSSEKDLDVFELKKYSASEEALLRLLPVVKASNKALLSGCNLSERSCGALIRVIQSSNLRELDLGNNNFQDSGEKLLSAALKSPHCKLESLRFEPGGVRWLRQGLMKYSCQLTIDSNSVHSRINLSDNNKATYVMEDQSYPDHPDRFDRYPQLLCTHGLTGRCYWEVEWRRRVHISVSYKKIRRKGDSNNCVFGENEQSWSLFYYDGGYSVCHRNKETSISSSSFSVSNRVAVYVDCPAGTLSFYRVFSDTLIHLHTFNTTFTEPLYAGFGLWSPGSSVCLCSL